MAILANASEITFENLSISNVCRVDSTILCFFDYFIEVKNIRIIEYILKEFN